MSSNLKNNTTTIQEILEMVNTLPEAGGSGGDTTTVEQATPTISVSSSGLITASATQTAGYVSAGTKSATKQLTTQAAKTITPGTSDKTIPSGRYLTGAQTIKGDANLVAGNIKSGVSIFGVAGSYEASGGGGGLPDGVSAIACGSFTPTEDISGTYVITHNLDAVPNFWSVTAIGPIDLASKPYCMLSQSFYKITTVRSDGVTLAGSRLIQYCTASGKGAITSSNVSNISGACTFSNIYLSGSTSWKLVAGVTYIWVVGVIDGLK